MPIEDVCFAVRRPLRTFHVHPQVRGFLERRWKRNNILRGKQVADHSSTVCFDRSMDPVTPTYQELVFRHSSPLAKPNM